MAFRRGGNRRRPAARKRQRRGARTARRGRGTPRRPLGIKEVVNVARLVSNLAIDARTRSDWTISDQNDFQYTAPMGAAIMKHVSSLGNNSDVYAMFAKAVSNGGSAVASAAQATQKVMIQSMIQNFAIQNAEIHAVNLQAFYCRPRRDIPNIASLDPITLLTDGWKAAGLTSADPSNQITVTPFMSSSFTKWFQIYKVKRFLLNPGQVVNVPLSSKPGRIINGSYLLPDKDSYGSDAACACAQFRGLSKFILFKWVGQPVNDSTNATLVSTGDAVINIIMTKRLTFSTVTAPPVKHFDVTGTFGAVATEKVPTAYTQVTE